MVAASSSCTVYRLGLHSAGDGAGLATAHPGERPMYLRLPPTHLKLPPLPPQVTALAQLLLDPYFRSLRGFGRLVAKEWLSFGHQFALRCGSVAPIERGAHAAHAPSDEQLSPIFLQFVEAVRCRPSISSRLLHFLRTPSHAFSRLLTPSHASYTQPPPPTPPLCCHHCRHHFLHHDRRRRRHHRHLRRHIYFFRPLHLHRICIHCPRPLPLPMPSSALPTSTLRPRAGVAAFATVPHCLRVQCHLPRCAP